MAPRRQHVLPDNDYQGRVSGIWVTYNKDTEKHVKNLGNIELKRFLEDAAVTATIPRGFDRVLIRSTPHTTTRNRKGERIPTSMHVTIDAGVQSLTAHIPVYGFDVTASNYYTNMTHGDPKWDDRVTSSNVSSASSPKSQRSH